MLLSPALSFPPPPVSPHQVQLGPPLLCTALGCSWELYLVQEHAAGWAGLQ